MTDTSAEPETRCLRALLYDVDRPAPAHAEELRRARERLTGDPDTAMNLARIELRFLERQAQRPDLGAAVVEAVAAARGAALDSCLARLLGSPRDDIAALFDLVELRAAYQQEGRDDQVAAAAAAIAERIAAVPLERPLRDEASERYATIMTDEEDLGFEHRICMMNGTAEVMQGLFERSSDRLYRKMARRLRRMAWDRLLYMRLERALTRRGVVALETTSLLLLLVVFVLLTIELTAGVSDQAVATIRLIDAGICSFFILEFLFKLALSPKPLSWFSRNVLTDLLPAIPAVLMVSDAFAPVRAMRFIRIVQVARYLNMFRTALNFFRLVLFLIRGLDAVVARFSPLINRNFVFFENGTQRAEELAVDDPRRLAYLSIRREHVLLDDLAAEDLEPILVSRATGLCARLRTGEFRSDSVQRPMAQARDITVEDAIERLHQLQPEELGSTMSRTDLLALDRVARVIDAPVIGALPFVRAFRSRQRFDLPEERVVALGRRIGEQLEKWRGRILFFADLHGIVTGPQILDRFATAMVNASKRPAVRLLMFGALFSVVRMFVSEDNILNLILKRFVATPLIVLGSVCFVILVIGRWLKRLAGEATETLKRTSEAHFINLLELVKARTRDSDLVFLARRVFRFEMDSWEAALALGQQVEEASSIQIDLGGERQPSVPPDAVREDLSRVAFLYMHFLDGAILHESDIKTTEQLLANLSLENIRQHHLRFSRRDRKRVRKLSLASGSILSGPYLWFRFITESVALETAKRITEYNRHCLTRQQRLVSAPEEIADMEAWLAKRRARVEGRMLEKIEPPDAHTRYRTTEFNSLDFLAVNERRDEQIERVFGPEVLEVLRLDRRSMIREIFGTRPLHQLPRSKRSVNFYRFFVTRLSRGRVLLSPLLFLGAAWWMLKGGLSKVMGIVREITHPELATARQQSGRAPFRIALRKIHRMKAPGLLEAMHMRAAFDPAYCGAPPSWSFGVAMEEVPELDRDMDFLQLRSRERAVMEAIADENRRRVEQLHAMVRGLDIFEGIYDAADQQMDRRLGERAVTIAYLTDRHGIRSLLQTGRWLERELPRLEDPATRLPGSWLRSLLDRLRRRGRRHPVDRLIDGPLAARRVSARGRRNLKRAWLRDLGDTRAIVENWLAVPAGMTPRQRAYELAVQVYRANGEVSRELVALRAVQSLSVLDVRNYRDLIFRLGGYAEDGEDPAISQALP